MTTTTRKPTILGISDEVTTCECCGKNNLKRTVVLGGEGGEVYYGTDCAAKALLGDKSTRNRAIVEGNAKAVSYARKMVARGYSLDDTSKILAMRFGRMSQVRGNALIIDGIGEVTF